MSRRDECAAIVRQLWPFLDDALPAAMQSRVTAHLEACANCRSHFDFEREFIAAVRFALAVDDVEPLRTRVAAALRLQGVADV